MDNRSIPGFQFLCEIFGDFYVSPFEKKLFRTHAQNELPFSKNDCKNIQNEFTNLVVELKKHRIGLWGKLDEVIGRYFNEISTLSFFSEAESVVSRSSAHSKSFDSMFKSLLQDQVGTSNVSFAGIAMTITLSVGYKKNHLFYLGGNDARLILSKSMDILGFDNSEFIPDDCFTLTDGNAREDLLCLLLLSLLGALKVKYPHKKNSEQSARNKEKARDIIDSLIHSDQTSSLFDALRESDEMSRICQSMMDALRDQSERVRFPNGKDLALEDFYRIPQFERIGNATSEILRSDINYCIRSMVTGKTGSGKSLLTKAIVRTCLEPSESRGSRFVEYAKALGLSNKSLIPLVLNCKDIAHKDDIKQIDLIEEAVYQLLRLVKTTGFSSYLSHWNDFALQIIAYFKRKAQGSSLLFIIEDIAWLDKQDGDTLLIKLRNMEQSDYYRLHILLVTQHLIPSQMRFFENYNKVEIVSLNFPLEKEIKTLVELGVSSLNNPTYYLELINSNRIVRAFLDSPRRLIDLLCSSDKEAVDIDTLLWRIIDESIEEYFPNSKLVQECRAFLTMLAVYIAEIQKSPRLFGANLCATYSNIPQNIVMEKAMLELCADLENPYLLWKNITSNMILVCPNSNINSFTFINPVFYYSLVADYYLQLIGKEQPPNWLHRFNSISAVDFSSIIVMLFRRLPKLLSYLDGGSSNAIHYNIFLLTQSVIGYVSSRTEPLELFYGLLAIQDIVSHSQGINVIQQQINKLLKQAYSIGYNSFLSLTDDCVMVMRLKKPSDL